MKPEDLEIPERVEYDWAASSSVRENDPEWSKQVRDHERWLSATDWIEWCDRDSWMLDEAVSLLDGESPTEVVFYSRRTRSQSESPKFGMIVAAVKIGALDAARTDQFEGEWLVRPPDLIVWAETKTSLQPLPQPLRVFLAEVLEKRQSEEKSLSSAPVKKAHGNTEVNAVKREQVLGAALACLAAWNEECRKKDGTVNIAGLERLVRDKAPLFWEDTMNPPLSDDTIKELFKTWIRKTT